MVDVMVARADELGEELTWQMGRPDRAHAERDPPRLPGARALHDGAAPRRAGRRRRRAQGRLQRFIRREPLGVVLVVAPWNYPYLTR